MSILSTSKIFGTQEKQLCQALKGIWYESGLQKWRGEVAAYDKDDESSSSKVEDDDDDDDEDEQGAFAKMKLLRQKKPKKWDHWKKWNSDTEVVLSLQSSLQALYTHQFLLSPHFIPNSPFQAHISHFRHPCQNLKKHTKFEMYLISVIISKSGPLNSQKPNTKYHKTFFWTKKEQRKKPTIIKPKLCHSSAFFTGLTLLKTFSFSSVIHNQHFFLNSHSTLLAWLGPLFHQSLPFSPQLPQCHQWVISITGVCRQMHRD